jgi:membrane protein CcdC involved in cytochrome C biogenesis
LPVVNSEHLPLEAWSNLYVVASTAAATLVGLLFVVITLTAERRPHTEAKHIRIYLTPTVIYFASVLLLSGALTFPTQSRLSATLCCCVLGAAGIFYALSLLWGSRRGVRFRWRGDPWTYSLLPAAAFSLIFAGGAAVYASDAGMGLTLVAVGMLALLAIALRNAWSIAVAVTWPRPDDGNAKNSG